MSTLFSIFISFILIFLLSPVLIIISFLNYLAMGRPILFKQMRSGYKGKPFVFYKYRTMTNENGADGKPLDDYKRITKIGSFLRKTSLDELPSLINVLKNDINLVGPRPLLIEYIPLYNEQQMRRHDVKPGITGWAQINGRNSISWSKKFEYDLWYVDNKTFFLDIKILILTFFKVIKSEGINQSESFTMKKFEGEKWN